MVLHCLSDEALKVYNGFHFDGEENVQTVEDITQKFEEFAVGQVNVTISIFFLPKVSRRGRIIREILPAIRGLSKTCCFCVGSA